MSYLPCSRFRIVTQWHAYIQQENNVSSFTATSVRDTSQWALPNENLPTREPNFLESRRALPTTTNSTTNHTALETLTEEEKTKTKMWLKGISYLSAWLQILKNNCDETHTPSAGAQSRVTTGWLLHWARRPLLQGEHSHASPPAVGAKWQVHVITVVLLCEFFVCKSELRVRIQPGPLCSTPAPSFTSFLIRVRPFSWVWPHREEGRNNEPEVQTWERVRMQFFK